MKKIRKVASVIFVIILLLSSSCGKSAVNQENKFAAQSIPPAPFASFRDIPGVTAAEITAIEELQKERDSFVYGMIMTDETFFNENGEIGGFSALFCNWLSEFFGISFKPAIYIWGDLLEGLANGGIDFSGELTASDERRKTFFMTDAIAERSIKYMRLADSVPLQIISSYRPLRYAFFAGSTTVNDISVHFRNVEYETFFVDSTDTVYTMLKAGEIDAFFGEGVEAAFDIYPDVTAHNVFPAIYGPVSLSTQKPELAPVISVMQKMLENGGVRFLTELYNAGEQDYMRHKLFMRLTEEERFYIKNTPVIPFAAEFDTYPLIFFNRHNEEWQGIAVDVLKEVELLTGLSFDIINEPQTEWPVLLEMLENGEVSMISELIRTEEREGRFLWPQNEVFTDYPALLSKMDFPDVRVNEVLFLKVGLVEKSGQAAMFHRWFPNHMNTVVFPSNDAGFLALERGEIDLLMLSQSRLLMRTHYLEQVDFKINMVFDYPFESTFGFHKDENVLCSIVDKALGLADTKRITSQWLNKTYDYRARLMAVQRPLLAGLSFLFLLVLILLAILFKRSRISGKRLEKLVGERTHDLHIQTTLLTTLLDSIPDLIFTKDLDLRFTQCNKALLENYGVRTEDVIGKCEKDLWIPGDLAEKYDELNRKVIFEGRTILLEEQIPHIDGKHRIYETIRLPLITDNVVIGVLGISHDITKRKEMEDEALAASRSKSAFLAHMSHEIRTPMNSIIGFSELAMDGETSLRTKEYLGKILENADGLLQIINNVLDISKVESGKMEIENIPFDMHELFASCRTLIMPKAVEKGITLHFYTEPSVDKMPLGDPTRLRQILVNLIFNAVKFTNTGMVKVLAEITEKSEKTISMYFEVRDSGIGMTAEQIDKIFDPFTQAEAGTTRKFGGTGLGLAITKNMVELMGGTLSVESTPGVGSKFSFALRFNTIDASDSGASDKIVFNEFEKPSFEGEILLCEDNTMNQQVICEHLARVGLKTVVAENGKIGVEMVQNRIEKGEKQFDLIFMDIHMPVMDGLDATEKILELDSSIPVIAMTANIMSTDRDVYRTSGMKDWVGKPFKSQELWRCLMKYFKPVKWQPVNGSRQTQAENELRCRLVKIFIKNNSMRYSEIKEAINSGDIKLAHRIAHNLKGNAGQLGKTLLQQAAADVEACLENGKNLVTMEQLQTLEKELDAVLFQLKEELGDKVFVQEQAQSTGELLDIKSALELIEKLEPMLESGNVGSRKFTEKLRLLPGDRLAIDQLIQNIDDFEFKTALVILTDLKKEIYSGLIVKPS